MFSSLAKLARASIVIICFLLAALFTSLAFPNFERAHWFRQVFWTAVHPFQYAATSISNFSSGIWDHYINLTSVAKENEELTRKLAEANRVLIETDEIRKENDRLHEMVSMAGEVKMSPLGARVIANNVMAEFRTVTVNKGSNDGLRKNMVTMGPGGLVGRVGKVGINESMVLLISDPNSSVDVFVQRTGTRAILTGSSGGTSLRPFYSLSRLEYLKRTSDIVNGDVLITSGFDQLFPRGIPVGTVTNVETAREGVFKGAEVVPFVDLAQLKEVVLLK